MSSVGVVCLTPSDLRRKALPSEASEAADAIDADVQANAVFPTRGIPQGCEGNSLSARTLSPLRECP